MKTIHEQSEANKFLEGGIFYPTGHMLVAFADSKLAAKGKSALKKAGFDDEQLLSIDARTMVHEAQENLDKPGLLSVGASLPARQKQLELAQQGCDFILIQAPEEEDHLRAIHCLEGLSVTYAVKYRALIIEDLIGTMKRPAADQESARVP